MPARDEMSTNGALSPQRLALLAKMLEQEGVSAQQKGGIPQRSNPDEYPLSSAQQRLCFLSLFEGGWHYNDHFHQRLIGTLSIPVLEQCLKEILRRHEAMRSTFKLEEGEVVQRIAPLKSFQLTRINLDNLPEDVRLKEATKLAVEEARIPFDLAKGPLWRFKLLMLSAKEHILLITAHHICIDGWSRGVFLRELDALYPCFLQGNPSPLPELPIQYADYAVWHNAFLKTKACLQQLEYWKQSLSQVPSFLALPADRSRPSVQTFNGARHFLNLPGALLIELRKISQTEGVTLFMCLLAAFQTLLQQYTGQDDIVVGSPVANRTRPEAEALIGFFLNTVVMRNDLSGDPAFIELLRRVRQTTLGALAHQDVPIERVFEAIPAQGLLRGSPRIQVLFILQNAPLPELKLPGCALRPFEIDNGTAKFDLTLSLCETGQGLSGWIQYSADLFNAERIERMSAHFLMLLENIVGNPSERISKLLPLDPAEVQALQRDRPRSHPHWSPDISAQDSKQCACLVDRNLQLLPASTAPNDALESKLVTIWQKVLGTALIGTTDNFFDLGGHSLTALRLFSEVRNLTGRHLPLATLFQAPTVRQLANILRDSGWTPPWSSLVPIRPTGTKPRFYCVHGGGGNVLLFRNLSRDLGPDYPFYALQSRGLNHNGNYLTTVEEMAAEYLKEIRDFQPEGPYCLGGFCMGGQVAYHMARLLTAAGEKVSLLVLFDTYNYGGVPLTRSFGQRATYLGQKARFHWQNIWGLTPGDRRIYLREKIREVRTREWERLSVGLRNLVRKRFGRQT